MNEIPCSECEQLLELYLDGELSGEEVRKAETHLDDCGYCRRRYRLERFFRVYLRQVTSEPISPALIAKLASLRTSAGRIDR
jgi:predicted anti-sigma-YlaC factor YlaD